MLVRSLSVTLLIALAFVVVSDAAYTLVTYSNSTCTDPISYFKSTGPCDKKKRSALGLCSNNGDNYYDYVECNSEAVSTTVLPADWQTVTFNTEENCNFTTVSSQLAVKYAESTVVIYDPAAGNIPLNSTVRCNENGILSFSMCVVEGCIAAVSMPENVCTNITDGILGRPFNGVQTTCVAPPVAPVTPPMAPPMAAPMVAPVAAPVAAPKAATAPVKKTSEATSMVIGSVVALITLSASLLW